MNEARNIIWANRLIAKTQTWEKLPDFRREAVKIILRSRVEENAITADQYSTIVGETYTA